MALGNMGAVGRGEYSDQVNIPGQPAEPVSDYQSKAVFENFLRDQGMDSDVEDFIAQNPDAFLTPAQMNRLDRLGPEAFWGGSTQVDSQNADSSSGFDSLIPKMNNGSAFTYQEYNSDGWLVAHYADGSTKYIVQDPSKMSTKTSNKSNLDLISTEQDPDTGQVIGYFSDGTSKILTPGKMSQKERDAYAILEDTFKSYNLESLVPVIRGYMEANLGSEQAALQLKMDPIYQRRFYGNTLRVQAGKNAISEAAYLDLENQYNEALSAYGLKGYFGTTRDQQIAGMAQIVGNDISAPEFADRIGTVVDRVQNADPNVKAALQGYYGINDNDLIKFYLNPKEGLAQLKQKTTAAEIGAASYEQLGKEGTIGATRAMELAQAGVDQATAMKGYATIGQILPETKKLSDIYGEAGINYTQQEAEKEVFNLSDAASAQRKRKRLAQLESAKFSGDSGVSSQASSLGSAVRGQF